MSIVVGKGRGARAGILVKNAEALQLLDTVDTLVIDKTGTVTRGRPTVTTVQVLGDFGEVDLLCYAAAVEQTPEHPLALAVVEAARSRTITIAPCEDFASQTGSGGDGAGVRPPDRHRQRNADDVGADPIPLAPCAARSRKEGAGLMLVAIDGRLAGLIAGCRSCRHGAGDALAYLRDQGLRIIMLTGDNALTARAVARKTGSIDEVRADLRVEDKAYAVEQLMAQGYRVAIAGDGINDAPALALAHVGIDMGTGTDVAIESAAITLARSDLSAIVAAHRLARATMRNIRQKLLFSFLFNGIGVPAAAGVLYPATGLLLPPMLAGGAMTLSSVLVIVNALRLGLAKL